MRVMDSFYAFLLFAGLLVLETLAAQSWLAPYFRMGIPVYYIWQGLAKTRTAGE